MMLRRTFLTHSVAAFAGGMFAPPASGGMLATAARAQVGVTRNYDPHYTRIAYPNGDVSRQTGVCADVIVRAGRDALRLDLQKLLHEDMLRDFAAYPRAWGLARPDTNIDHRRVLNLETYFRRSRCEVWKASAKTAGDGFPGKLLPGDILTWRLDGKLPHIGMVVANGIFSTRVVHNWGNGAEESRLGTFAPHRAAGHYRWPA